MFVNNRHQLFKELDGDAQEEQEAPDADAAVEFWSNISDQTTKHNQETGWLDDVGEGLQDHVPRQSNIEINVQEAETQLKRIPNWKAPGPDRVQGFCLKTFLSLHGPAHLHHGMPQPSWCCLLRRSKEGCKTVLTSSNESQSLSEIGIRRGIFQGDYISSLLFVIAMIPLTLVLRNVKPGYVLRNDQIRIYHLLFMDDLTLNGKNEREIESLVQTVRINIVKILLWSSVFKIVHA